MEERGSDAKALTFEQLAELRQRTETIAGFLRARLQSHLETMRPVFAPRRLLGKYADRKEDVVGSEKAVAQLREKFSEACGAPLSLTSELDEDMLGRIDNRPELYAWEYTYEARDGGEPRDLTITSPVRWILTYGSGYTLSQVRQAMAGKHERRSDHLRQFVLNALVMQLFLSRYPGIGQLLTDLRYQVQVDKCPGLGALPFVTVSACLPSFRPADNLILMATRFSGVSNFVELIDVDAVHALEDPLKPRIQELLR
ncbi:MAG TPA: hypothetical protein VLT62_19575 [Candidatus Methylomirabilis sp.]|nr:hypothetical protein [Candidatus Methylomirabilis sp.]HSB77665.1 hypothetical protein [Candidatus Methylomirabilis sp.]